MKNYRLKYRNAEKRWKKAIEQYYNETGFLIRNATYTNIMFIKDPEDNQRLIYNPELPKYLTSADKHMEEADDDLICFKQHHRNRKQRKYDYIHAVNLLKLEQFDEQIFQKEKQTLWFIWMKK